MNRMDKKLAIVCLLLLTSFTTFGQIFNNLYIPPLMNGPVYNLNMQNGIYLFSPGSASPSRGFNGNILGPTLVLWKGQLVKLNVTNHLGEETTVHWHGLHVSPENDGGPHGVIAPNELWSPTFTVLNHAATYWYHPHLHLQTDIQVSQGLAGMLIVKDSAENAFNLPRTYGKDDFPVIVQTKAINASTREIMAPVYKDTILMVNATRNAKLVVPRQMVRLRLLNGSSHRVFNFGLTNDIFFYQIASDDGLLSFAKSMNRLMLAPGERAEILVNFGVYAIGQPIALKSYASEMQDGIFGANNFMNTGAPQSFYSGNSMNGNDFTVLTMEVGNATTASTPVTSGNVDLSYDVVTPLSTTSGVDRTRNKYVFPSWIKTSSTPTPAVLYEENTVNDGIGLDDKEVWVFHGDPHESHYIHIHDIHFFITERRDSNGTAIIRPPGEVSARKDVFLIRPGEQVTVVMQFTDFTSDVPYVYHCHVLEHEDGGMMYNFTVRDDIYIDKNYAGTSTGSNSQPFNNFSDAVVTAKDGSSIIFKTGADHIYPSDVTVQSKRLRIKLNAGQVVLK